MELLFGVLGLLVGGIGAYLFASSQAQRALGERSRADAGIREAAQRDAEAIRRQAEKDADRIRWWRVLTNLRWGCGLANQTAQHLDGRFRSIVMAGSGRRVSELAWDTLMLVRP